MNNNKKNGLDIAYAIVDGMRIIAICCFIVLLVISLLTRRCVVEGQSMYPTIQHNQQAFINVANAWMNDIERFDIVVVREEHEDELWVKRVIGLPNETIAYQNGKLYIDGKLVEETFLNQKYVESELKRLHVNYFTEDYPSYTLADDEYFLVGDNRFNSLDSRYASVGAFKRKQIVANGILVYYPFKDFRYISK